MKLARFLVLRAVARCRSAAPQPSAPEPVAEMSRVDYVPDMSDPVPCGRFSIEVPQARGSRKSKGRSVAAFTDILDAMPHMRRLANAGTYGACLQLRDTSTGKLIAFQAPPGGASVRQLAAAIRAHNEDLADMA